MTNLNTAPKTQYAVEGQSSIEAVSSSSMSLLNNPLIDCSGEVLGVSGLTLSISDRMGLLEIGARVRICMPSAPENSGAGDILAEVVGLGEGQAQVLPFASAQGVHRGARVIFEGRARAPRPTQGWLGRVVNGLGEPIDGEGPLPKGADRVVLRGTPPPAASRARLGERIDFGIKALDSFTPARAGQRLGIFSGSGVGKSSLLGMFARHTACDVRIIALIGERGREVREFIDDELGPDGLAQSIVIVSTADEPALMRREAGYLAMALAEHFRDQGQHVLCMMDSLTRIAMAQREIGLAAGEPPATKGYTPSVFSLLPALLERAGPGLMIDPEHPERKSGAITGLFTVLVEGDDHDEPIADHARAILDGHIVLDRAIADRGRFPAINILRSLSRTAADTMSESECDAYIKARQHAALHESMADMITLGAYKPGTNPDIDIAIDFCARLEEFLTQARDTRSDQTDSHQALVKILTDLADKRANSVEPQMAMIGQ